MSPTVYYRTTDLDRVTYKNIQLKITLCRYKYINKWQISVKTMLPCELINVVSGKRTFRILLMKHREVSSKDRILQSNRTLVTVRKLPRCLFSLYQSNHKNFLVKQRHVSLLTLPRSRLSSPSSDHVTESTLQYPGPYSVSFTLPLFSYLNDP